MSRYLPRIALMLGNVVIGLSVLAPAGMLARLADGLHVGIRDVGLLVTYGAVVLCIGSPLVAWLTAHVDRRLLLAGSLALVAIGQAVSALAPDYATILIVRLMMLAAAAVYTPQAAATAAMIVPERERASAIAFVFLGWTLTIAGGLPLVTLLATHFGWRTAFGALALFSVFAALLLFTALPSGLQGRAMPLTSFAAIVRSKRILLILLLTLLQTSGQFTVFVYLAPLLKRLAGAGPGIVGAFLRAATAWGARRQRDRQRQRSRRSASSARWRCSSARPLSAWCCGRRAPARSWPWAPAWCSGASASPPPIRCSRRGWPRPRPSSPASPSRSIPRCSISGRRSAPASAACCSPAG